MQNTKTKIAIITGASSGMGKEFVKGAASRYDLDEIWVVARRKDRLEALQNEIKTKIVPVPLDLTKAEDISALSRKLAAETPDVFLLVNASGYGKFGEFCSSLDKDSAGMCDLNLKALILVTRAVMPYMSAGAKIMEIGSISAFMPVPSLPVYAATKAAVLSFTRSLNHELKPRKIHALCVCPYWVKTEFFNRANEEFKIKKLDVLYEPEFIAKKAFRALDKTKKDYIVPGAYAKLILFAAKILPHKLIMKIMDKKFRFEKQNV